MAEYTREDIINTPFAAYDKEADYDTQIAPLIEQLIRECKRLGIPFVAAACVQQTAAGDIMLAHSGTMGGGPAFTPGRIMAAKALFEGDIEQVLATLAVESQRSVAQAQRLTSGVH